jgi:hypothetical protein
MVEIFDLNFRLLLSHSLKIPLTLPATCGMWVVGEKVGVPPTAVFPIRSRLRAFVEFVGIVGKF